MLLTMIMYMVSILVKSNSLMSEAAAKNKEMLPKAENELFNYTKMQPVFREANVQDLIDKSVHEYAK